MRIGIFGGSFNPVHAGHLRLAAEALSELNLDRVIFVPSKGNPLKDATGLRPGRQRAACLRHVLKGQPRFSVDLCEIRRPGLSYTIDTVKYFSKKFKNRAVLYFLAGADTLADFPRWKSFGQILRYCRVAVFSRPGASLRRRSVSDILRVPMDALELSSTQVRKDLRWN